MKQIPYLLLVSLALLLGQGCTSVKPIRSIKEARKVHRVHKWKRIDLLMESSQRKNRDIVSASVHYLTEALYDALRDQEKKSRKSGILKRKARNQKPQKEEELPTGDRQEKIFPPASDTENSDPPKKTRKKKIQKIKKIKPPKFTSEQAIEKIETHLMNVYASFPDFNVRNLCIRGLALLSSSEVYAFLLQILEDPQADNSTVEMTLVALRSFMANQNVDVAVGYKKTLALLNHVQGNTLLVCVDNLFLYRLPLESSIETTITEIRSLLPSVTEAHVRKILEGKLARYQSTP